MFATVPEGNWFGFWSKNSSNVTQQEQNLGISFVVYTFIENKQQLMFGIIIKKWSKNCNVFRLFFSVRCLLCLLNSRVVVCQQANVEERGRETKERRGIVSRMDAVILINPLDGVTAGQPKPSAACFLSKQDCLTWSLSHAHISARELKLHRLLILSHTYCLLLFLSHTHRMIYVYLWVLFYLSHTHTQTRWTFSPPQVLNFPAV